MTGGIPGRYNKRFRAFVADSPAAGTSLEMELKVVATLGSLQQFALEQEFKTVVEI
jgi:hypothetical protein